MTAGQPPPAPPRPKPTKPSCWSTWFALHRSTKRSTVPTMLSNGRRMPGTIRRVTTAGSLYRLIYRSRQVIAHVVPDAATEAGLQRQLRTIVSAARFHNKAANITGALLFTGAGFVQVLEGAREVVERTFDRIA